MNRDKPSGQPQEVTVIRPWALWFGAIVVSGVVVLGVDLFFRFLADLEHQTRLGILWIGLAIVFRKAMP